jgi:hypothetical protein
MAVGIMPLSRLPEEACEGVRVPDVRAATGELGEGDEKRAQAGRFESELTIVSDDVLPTPLAEPMPATDQQALRTEAAAGTTAEASQLVAWLFADGGAPIEASVADLAKHTTIGHLGWLDLSGYAADELRSVASQFGLPDSAVRIALQPWQRPRLSIDGGPAGCNNPPRACWRARRVRGKEPAGQLDSCSAAAARLWFESPLLAGGTRRCTTGQQTHCAACCRSRSHRGLPAAARRDPRPQWGWSNHRMSSAPGPGRQVRDEVRARVAAGTETRVTYLHACGGPTVGPPFITTRKASSPPSRDLPRDCRRLGSQRAMKRGVGIVLFARSSALATSP